MATLDQRLLTLEKQSSQCNANFHVVFCKGEEASLDERAEAENYAHTIFVSFVQPKEKR
jgi:hypothetical protein